MKRRVAVTGMGIVSPIGIGVHAFYNSLLNGLSGASRITKFDVSDPGYKSRVAAEVKDFKAKDYGLPRQLTRNCDLFAQYALVAAQEAVKNSGLDLEKRTADELKNPRLLSSKIQEHFEQGRRRGVVIGSGMGGVQTILEQYERLKTGGPSRVSAFAVPKSMVSSASVALSLMYHGLNNYSGSNSHACGTGSFSIYQGYKLIIEGDADIVITGSADALMIPLVFISFQNMGALTTRYNDEPERASRPFDKYRDGFLFSGEGAGVLVLEDMEHARKRGANILAEILGFGITTDGYHISAPEPDSFCSQKAIEYALDDAGISPEEIDLINPHGTSTPYNDKFETLALKKALGERASQIPVTATKCLHGHMVGATSSVEVIAGILAMQNSVVFPNINYDNPDPECDLNISKERREGVQMRYMLKNATGFGGHNIAMVVGIPKE